MVTTGQLESQGICICCLAEPDSEAQCTVSFPTSASCQHFCVGVTQFLILNRWETEQGRQLALAPVGLNLNPFRNQTSHMTHTEPTWLKDAAERCLRDSSRSRLLCRAGQWYSLLRKVESPSGWRGKSERQVSGERVCSLPWKMCFEWF